MFNNIKIILNKIKHGHYNRLKRYFITNQVNLNHKCKLRIATIN